jgi:hypothetical protein
MQGERARPYVIVICVVFTIIMALLAFAGFATVYEMSARGKVASARVVEKPKLGKSGLAIVEFTTDTGRHVRVKIPNVKEKAGATIRVNYLPGHPDDSVEKVGSHSNALWAGGPAFMTLVSAVLTVGLATGRLLIKDERRIVRARRRRSRHGREA